MSASFNIAKVILSGEFESPGNSDDLLEQAGRILDRACVSDGVGDHLFQGDDGKLYIVTFEACVSEADPTYAKSLIQQRMDDLNTEDDEHKALRQLLMKQVRDAVEFLKSQCEDHSQKAIEVHDMGQDLASAIEIIILDWNQQDYEDWTLADVIAFPEVNPEVYEAQL